MKFSLRQLIQAKIRIMLSKLKSSGLNVGNNIYIGKNTTISSIYSLSIGNNVYIGKNVTIECEGKIGNNCLIANNVGIVGRRDHDFQEDTDIFHASTVRENRKLSSFTLIEDDVWIGFGAIILSGITIGEGTIISAGSVVKENTPKMSIIAGNPAKVIGQRVKSSN